MKGAQFAAAAAALVLGGCGAHGYVYDYDPYLGPVGRYVDAAPRRPSVGCAQVEYVGPLYGGWRGPYFAGPYCRAPALSESR